MIFRSFSGEAPPGHDMSFSAGSNTRKIDIVYKRCGLYENRRQDILIGSHMVRKGRCRDVQ